MAMKVEKSTKILKNVTILIVFYIFYVSGNHEKKSGIFYILKAINKSTRLFHHLTAGNETFCNNNCAFINCFITDDVSYFKDTRNFDAVLFNAVDLYKDFGPFPLPKQRSSYQKYIFVSTESATNHPVQQGDFDGFFNWTWTYRFDSDILFQYIVIRNALGQVIGPKKDMHWMDTDKMKPTSEYTISKLQKKTIAAAWSVFNCDANNKRLEFAYRLSRELIKYGERLDIYGHCGILDCPDYGREESYYAMIERDYFFYLAFENSFSEDYVTGTLLTALENFAVPIVYGGANYTRFMPDGIYINARSFVPENLAKEMVHIIQNKDKYYEYFKWHRYYSYSRSSDSAQTNNICRLCTMLNNDTQRTQINMYRNFSLWWNESQPVNFPEPEIASHADREMETLVESTSTTNMKRTTHNSIKEFLSNVLEYYETV